MKDETVAMAYKLKESNLGPSNSSKTWVRRELYHGMLLVFQVIATIPAAKVAISRVALYMKEVYEPASISATEWLEMRANQFYTLDSIG